MKTYLVTGAAGFIGANYVKYMLAKYDDVRIVVLDALTYAGYLGTIAEDIDDNRCYFVKGNICDQRLVAGLFEQYDFDVVVNFAAESHVDRSIENPQLFLETNILGTQNLLDCARRVWVTGKDAQGYPTWREGVRYHQVSTDEVYGSLGLEGYFTEQTPLDPHSPYSASKTSADHIVCAYRDTFHMPVSITRCSNNYGPYQFPEKLIPLIINNILSGKSLPVYGKGENIRDWLYVEDHCKAIDMVVRQAKDGSIYNVGGHNERKNIDIVRLIIRTIHDIMAEQPEMRRLLKKQERDGDGNIRFDWISDDLITYVKDRLGHDQRYGIDPSKIKADLGWYPETTFEVGIVKTIRWNLEHRAWIEAVSGDDYQQYYEQMYGKK
ncbi:MAG: dTDP-glucose 4,6-dehydratase [Bacteroidales bacterium]|nr:dTDP-glucose 4,6-dehydratase [Candidatus Equimonas enterica]